MTRSSQENIKVIVQAGRITRRDCYGCRDHFGSSRTGFCQGSRVKREGDSSIGRQLFWREDNDIGRLAGRSRVCLVPNFWPYINDLAFAAASCPDEASLEG